MLSFAINPTVPTDLPQILTIDRLCLGGFWSLASYGQELVAPHSHMVTIGSAQNVVLGYGCLWFVVDEAHLILLVVHPDYQKQGLGRALLWSLLITAIDKSAEWIVLEVKASNQRAIGLYQQYGFVEVGRRHNYYPETGEDALILWRKGLQSPDFLTWLQTDQKQIITKLDRGGLTWLPSAKLEQNKVST